MIMERSCYINQRQDEAYTLYQDGVAFQKSVESVYDEIDFKIKLPDFLGKTVKVTQKQFPEVYRIVSELSADMNIESPTVYVYEDYYYGSWLYGQQAGDNTLQKVLDTINGMGGAFVNPFPSFMPGDLLVGVGCGIGFRMVVYYKAKNAKKFRQGVEYGSARWGTAKDIEPYVDPVFENNVLSATERLMMSGRPKQPKYARNKNILVIGGSGSGKTRFFVKPNLMQMHSSYVVTDPKGTVLVECGRMLSKNDYRIKVLNTINFAKSMHYNPFAYIRSEKDILKLVNTIIVNTKGEGQQASEDFWVKAKSEYHVIKDDVNNPPARGGDADALEHGLIYANVENAKGERGHLEIQLLEKEQPLASPPKDKAWYEFWK